MPCLKKKLIEALHNHNKEKYKLTVIKKLTVPKLKHKLINIENLKQYGLCNFKVKDLREMAPANDIKITKDNGKRLSKEELQMKFINKFNKQQYILLKDGKVWDGRTKNYYKELQKEKPYLSHEDIMQLYDIHKIKKLPKDVIKHIVTFHDVELKSLLEHVVSFFLAEPYKNPVFSFLDELNKKELEKYLQKYSKKKYYKSLMKMLKEQKNYTKKSLKELIMLFKLKTNLDLIEQKIEPIQNRNLFEILKAAIELIFIYLISDEDEFTDTAEIVQTLFTVIIVEPEKLNEFKYFSYILFWLTQMIDPFLRNLFTPDSFNKIQLNIKKYKNL